MNRDTLRKVFCSTRRSFVSLAFVMLVLSVLACSQSGNEPPVEATTPKLQPAAFFPGDQKSEWTYRIKIGEVEPLSYKEVMWPLSNDRAIVSTTRGRFWGLVEKQEQKIFMLKMKTVGSAAKQGPFEYPKAIEMAIEQDELGIYKFTEKVFWAIPDAGRFMVNEIIIYSPDLPGAPLDTVTLLGLGENPYSLKLKFFIDEPGIQIGLGEEPKDVLLFKEFTSQVSEYAGNSCPCLHFVRTVGSAEKKIGEAQSNLDKGFTEDMWFASGKGLVRLEQQVEGKTSMVWTLVE